MLKDLKNIKAYEFIVGVVVFLAIRSPGFLIIWLSQPKLVIELETIKLIIFSTSLTLPLFLISLHVCCLHNEGVAEAEEIESAVLFDQYLMDSLPRLYLFVITFVVVTVYWNCCDFGAGGAPI